MKGQKDKAGRKIYRGRACFQWKRPWGCLITVFIIPVFHAGNGSVESPVLPGIHLTSTTRSVNSSVQLFLSQFHINKNILSTQSIIGLKLFKFNLYHCPNIIFMMKHAQKKKILKGAISTILNEHTKLFFPHLSGSPCHHTHFGVYHLDWKYVQPQDLH